MRELIAKGFLGGCPVHMESVWCYDLGDRAYAQAVLGDKKHWVRNLPGGLLHNIINHGVSRIVEYLKSDDPIVIAHGFTSPIMKRAGIPDMIDELRVIIDDRNNTTAYFTFSTQIKPLIRQFRVLGPTSSILIDDMHHMLVKTVPSTYKSFLNFFVPPIIYAHEYLSNCTANMKRFVQKSLAFEYGRKISDRILL